MNSEQLAFNYWENQTECGIRRGNVTCCHQAVVNDVAEYELGDVG
jgi:hypothetical protein